MNRNMDLVRKRENLIGVFIGNKKRRYKYTTKKAVEEAAFIFSVSEKTAYMDYTRYRNRKIATTHLQLELSF
ncbi:hypothetical protein [Zunongwangia sp.]|uniref:hypothetical protein n=1 Tax=Zunongwangia sp. TaxID=1965325 RepID=UPI003AA8EBF6